MNTSEIDSTRAASPGSLPRLPPGVRPVLAAGGPVPGLSSWTLDRRLGGGGFGEVWLARHAWDAEQPPRAVKFCTDPVARHQLVTHEQNVVRRVMKYAGKHPNIVPLLECNLDGDAPWLMYEYVAGGTLAGALGQWRRLPPARRAELAVRTLLDLAAGLAACHRLDPPLVHRDMKPHNVLMADGAVPRITDFGIGGIAVRPSDAPAGGSATAGAAVLPSGLRAAGTRIYAPPEQLLGSEPHPRDDVYALGVIAYQLVTADLGTAPGTDAAYELRRLRAPEPLVELVVRSAAINPDRRPQSAGEWADELAVLVHRTHRLSDTPDPALTEAEGLELTPTAAPSARTELLPVAAPAQPAPPARVPAATQQDPRPAIRANWRVWPTAAAPRKRRQSTNAWVAVAALLFLAGLIACAAYMLPGGTGWGGGRPGAFPGEARDFRLPGGGRMTFCWVPAGSARLGSTRAERDALARPPGHPAGWLADEAEEKRGAFTADGFWMGKYEVTQAEWEAVMSDAPSHFRAGGRHAPAVGHLPDTGRLPVEGVSWDRCQEFVARMNGLAAMAPGARGHFVLPTEDMWEYACRGGHGGQAFHFGGALNGGQANVDGGQPFGAPGPGPSAGRPVAVGSYEAAAPHPWGLCDMHGNVWEWCADRYEGTLARVGRGGAWSSPAADARSARRAWYSPEARRPDLGVRLCWVPE